MKRITWTDAMKLVETNHESVRKTAKDIGLSPTTYYRIIHDGYIPSLKTMHKIMDWIGVEQIIFERRTP